MAIIKTTAAGSGFSGSVGSVYYKVVNGKQILCSKPTHYRVPQDPKSVEIRHKMHIMSQIIKPITRTPFFKEIWKLDEIKGRGPYNKCFSFNYKKDVPFSFSSIKLAPKAQITAEMASFSFNKTKVNIILKPLNAGSGIDINREPYIAVQGFVYDEEFKTSKIEFDVYNIPQVIKPVDLINPMNFEIEINEKAAGKFKVLLLISTMSSLQQPVRHSDTIFYSKD